MTRSRFLRRLAGAMAMAMSPGLALSRACAQAAKPFEGTMLKRPIPASGEQIGVVGIGTWQTFDAGEGAAERAPLQEVLRLLFEAGGSMIDSSPMYGRAEAVTGDLLAAMRARDKAFLATKVWTTGEAAGRAQMQQSLDRFRTKSIELMQVHNLVDWRTQLRTMRAWQAEGKFRHLGITHYTTSAFDDLANVLNTEKLAFLQIPYSIATTAAERRLLPLAREKGVAVIANQPFEGGALFRKAAGKPLPSWAAEIGCKTWSQVFLKFILGHADITCVIPGTARPDHAADNLAAGFGRLPDAALRKRMQEYWAAV